MNITANNYIPKWIRNCILNVMLTASYEKPQTHHTFLNIFLGKKVETYPPDLCKPTLSGHKDIVQFESKFGPASNHHFLQPQQAGRVINDELIYSALMPYANKQTQ